MSEVEACDSSGKIISYKTLSNLSLDLLKPPLEIRGFDLNKNPPELKVAFLPRIKTCTEISLKIVPVDKEQGVWGIEIENKKDLSNLEGSTDQKTLRCAKDLPGDDPIDPSNFSLQEEIQTISINGFDKTKVAKKWVFLSPENASLKEEAGGAGGLVFGKDEKSHFNCRTVEKLRSGEDSFYANIHNEKSARDEEAKAICEQGQNASWEELVRFSRIETQYQGEISAILKEVEKDIVDEKIRELRKLAKKVTVSSSEDEVIKNTEKYKKQLEKFKKEFLDRYIKELKNLHQKRKTLTLTTEDKERIDKEITYYTDQIYKFHKSFDGHKSKFNNKLGKYMLVSDAEDIMKINLLSELYGLTFTKKRGSKKTVDIEDVPDELDKRLSKFQDGEVKAWEESYQTLQGDTDAIEAHVKKRNAHYKRALREKEKVKKKIQDLERDCRPNFMGKINQRACITARKKQQKYVEKYQKYNLKLSEYLAKESDYIDNLGGIYDRGVEQRRLEEECEEDESYCDFDEDFFNIDNISGGNLDYFTQSSNSFLDLTGAGVGQAMASLQRMDQQQIPMMYNMNQGANNYCAQGSIPNGYGGCSYNYNMQTPQGAYNPNNYFPSNPGFTNPYANPYATGNFQYQQRPQVWNMPLW